MELHPHLFEDLLDSLVHVFYNVFVFCDDSSYLSLYIPELHCLPCAALK